MQIKGIDTLEFGVEVENYNEKLADLLIEIEKLKIKAQEMRNGQVIKICNINFTVKPKGQGFYAYKLECDDFHLCFAKEEIANTPPIYVRFISQFLWSAGYEKAIEVFMVWLSDALNIHIIGNKLSRLDVCLDTDEVNFLQEDVELLVGKAKKREVCYADSVNYVGKKFTGFVVGKGGNISCRIYNKTIEIISSKKNWFKDIWKENGWNELNCVWRIEFQLRREALKELSIGTTEDIFRNLDALWNYLTKKWLTIREMNDKANISRCKLDERWQKVQNVVNVYNLNEILVRRCIKKGRLDILLNQCCGLILSICAVEDKESLTKIFPLLSDHLYKNVKKKNSTFKQELEKRKNRYMTID